MALSFRFRNIAASPLNHFRSAASAIALLVGIRKHDAAAWSQSFLEYLKRVRATDDPVA